MNRLDRSPSHYLQQHAHQPIHWNEWSSELLERAAAEGKWLLVSIGYATCHWCHVMAHEVFDDPEVAEILNSRWISIKVDREVRPDLDQAYMAASLAMTGQGGWPLNAICLPDGRPVWIATYLPKGRFVAALRQLETVRAQHSLEAADYAEQVRQALNPPERTIAPLERPSDGALREAMAQTWDDSWGGFRGAPKFPLPATWSAVLRWSRLNSWPEGVHHVNRTVSCLLRSGTYDLLRGGLCRYSTDGAWVLPHFEKMLYDSAQFASLCAELGTDESLTALGETLEFMERDLLRPDGLFAAALDADHPDGEGRHATWTHQELEACLGSDAPAWFDVLSRESRLHDGAWVIATGSDAQPHPHSLPGFSKLRAAALQRPLPATDRTCVISWNALAVRAFADGAQRSGRTEDRERLQRLAAAHRAAFADGAVHAHYPDGRVNGPAFLDDLVYSVHMALRCGQVLLDPEWIDVAVEWFERSRASFERDGAVYFAPEGVDSPAFADILHWDDDVLPNTLSLWAECALILGHIRQRMDWVDWATQWVQRGLQVAWGQPSRHASWVALAELVSADRVHWLIQPKQALGPRPIPPSPLWGPLELPQSTFAQCCSMSACLATVGSADEWHGGPNPFRVGFHASTDEDAGTGRAT